MHFNDTEQARKSQIVLEQTIEAYWNALEQNDMLEDISIIKDCAIYVTDQQYNFDDITNTQWKSIFSLLNVHNFANGIQWGFDDSETNASICEQFLEEKETILNILKNSDA